MTTRRHLLIVAAVAGAWATCAPAPAAEGALSTGPLAAAPVWMAAALACLVLAAVALALNARLRREARRLARQLEEEGATARREAVRRQAAETARTESAARLRLAFEASPVAQFLWDAGGAVSDANDAFLDLSGYQREDLREGRLGWAALLAPERAARDAARFRAPIAGVEECELLRKDGGRLVVLLGIASLPGEPGRGLATLVDRSADHGLRATAERNRRLVELSPSAIFIQAASGIVFANPAAERLVGALDPRQVLGRQVADFAHPDASAALAERLWRLDQAQRGGPPLEARFVRLDGTVIEIEVEVERIDYDGQPAVHVVIRDISRRKRAEDQLRASEERYRALADNSGMGIWHLDAAGGTVYANRAMCALLEVDGVEALAGRSFRDFFSADSVRVIEREFEKRRQGRPSQYEVELVGLAGGIHHVAIHGGPLMSPEGRLEGMIATFIDLTGRKQLEEQLRQSQKMEAIGQLAGGVAHDFNNLLTVITGYGELHLQNLASQDPRRRGVEQMLKAAKRAAALTQQLLAFSRRQVLQPKVLDLNAVVVDMESMLRRLIGEDIELVTALAPDLGQVKADPNQIEQVLLNLAVNARDAMPHGGRLAIETGNVELDEIYTRLHPTIKPGWCVMLSVSDTGVGMDQETQARIFEPFFTTKELGKGTGLGLATVYGIVKQSGGNIWFSSEPGKGTVFKIYLPRIEIGDADEPATAPAGVEAIPAAETILLVEDELDVRELISEMLGAEGYTIIEAGNGSEALALCESGRYHIDLVMTDVVMPQMNGPELAERLADILPETKVLFMSGYMDKVIVKRGVADPDFLFLEKPFTSAVLLRKVREALDRKQA